MRLSLLPPLKSLDPRPASPRRIRYGGAVGGAEEIAAAALVLGSRYWACGDEVEAFEKELASWLGVSAALFVNSGSSGLLLALSVLPPGSRVAMPALQFPTLYSASRFLGHEVVIVDVDDSLNLDPKRLEGLRDVDAVVFVALAGNPTNLREVARWCRENDALLIEDNCEGFGGSLAGRKVGTFGDISVTSFQSAHQISTGEGGAVFVNDSIHYDAMRSLRDWGRAWPPFALPGYHPNYTFDNLGFNFRASDIQAAVGRVQLRRLEGFVVLREGNRASLVGRLIGAPVELPRVEKAARPAWFAFPMLCPERSELARYLEDRDIETRPLIAGNVARQPFASWHDSPAIVGGRMVIAPHPRRRIEGDFPMAERAFHEGLWISVHPSLEIADLDRMESAVKGFYALGQARTGTKA